MTKVTLFSQIIGKLTTENSVVVRKVIKD